MKVYEKALKFHKNDELIYFNIARVSLDKGDSRAAQKNPRLALNINPDFPEALDLLREAELGLKI